MPKFLNGIGKCWDLLPWSLNTTVIISAHLSQLGQHTGIKIVSAEIWNLFYYISFHKRIFDSNLIYHFLLETMHGPSLSYSSWNYPAVFEKDDAWRKIDDDNQTSMAYDHTQAKMILYSLCNRDMLAFHKCSILIASHKQKNHKWSISMQLSL